MRKLVFSFVVGASLFVTHSTFAAEDAPSLSTFDRMISLSAYGVGWAGAYSGGGAGGRLAIVPHKWFGLELFAEAVFVDSPGGFRHDHPVGFDMFVPIRLGERVRIRPLAGMCVVFSLQDPDQPDGPRSDDVLFGLQAGAGLDVALIDELSLFTDLKAIGYLGHDRSALGWSGSVGEEYRTFGLGQAILGLSVHVQP
ncbi:MAG: hypothetical protein U0271_09440 [Polyangiaceae bacterium]